MPFDQFVRWQVAGDELAPDEPLALTATGFLGPGPFPTQLTEAEFESARYEELNDMASTTGVAFLGLSVGCARCHDHKFDPIPAEDYYRMAATFTTTIRSEIDLPPGGAPAQSRGPAEGAKVLMTSEGSRPSQAPRRRARLPALLPADVRTWPRRRPPEERRKAWTPATCVLMRDGRARPGAAAPPEAGARTSFRRAALADWLTDAEHGAGHWRRAWPSTGSGSTTSAAGSSPRPTTSAPRASGRPTPSCSTGSPASWSAAAGGSSAAQADRDQRRLHAGRAEFDEARARDRPGEHVPLAAGPAAARGRADPRRHARGLGPARRADVRPRHRSTRR